MARRSELLSDTFLTKADNGMHSEPRDIPGSALEIRKRNGGKTMRAYFRYNGTKWGEKRCMRIPLGLYHRGDLLKLRNKCVAYEQLIEKDRSPARYKERAKEQLRSAGMTFREALEEFWQYAVKVRWNDKTRNHNERTKRNHIYPMPMMDMPIEDIRGKHMDENFGVKWRSLSGTGPRIRSLVHSTFQYQIDKDDGVYRGPNPASWRQASSASQALGPQLPSRPHPGVHWKDIAKVFAYFSRPMDHWVRGYLSTMQSAAAWEIDPKVIRSLDAYKRFEGVIKAPRTFKASTNLYPRTELVRVLGCEPKHEPKPHEQESAILNAALMRFEILTPVRPSNATELRWRNIREDIEGGVIVYMPKRWDRAARLWLPSEHKNGWKYDYPYLVVLTDNLREIIEEQRQIQIRDGIEITPDGFVFLHGKCRTGRRHWFRQPSSHRTLDDYIKNACERLVAEGETIKIIPEGATKPTPAGLRGATFATWAKDHGHTDDEIDLSLGHVIAAIRNNPTNWSYFWGVQMIPARRKMMQHWERHVMSLTKPLRNLIEFPQNQHKEV
jgi:integrase